MLLLSSFLVLHAVIASASATLLNASRTSPHLRDECIVTDFNDVATATANCLDIEINGITVPGGQQLDLFLQDGATLTFSGTITFEYYQWNGPLVYIKGKALTVKGAEGHVLDGQGNLYWHGRNDTNDIKPVFIYMAVTGGSVFSNINLLNCPTRCVAVDRCQDLVISDWNIDCSAGDEDVAPSGKSGHNTDGFDIAHCQNVVIKDSVVHNQDDCIAINQGTDLTFSNLHCIGSHGLDVAVGFSSSSLEENTASNILFTDCTLTNCMYGVHVISLADGGPGIIKNVTFRNIEITGATDYAIIVQQDYVGGSTGVPNNNVEITDLYLEDVTATVTGQYGTGVYILCGDNSCSNFQWTGVSVSGAPRADSCNYKPDGYSGC